MSIICAICLTELDFSKDHISATECGHMYHKACLKGWIKNKPDCPECRKVIKTNQTVDRVYANLAEGSVEYKGTSSKTKDILKTVYEQFNSSVNLFLNRIVELENENNDLKSQLDCSKKSMKAIEKSNTTLETGLRMSHSTINALDRAKKLLDVKVEILEKKLTECEKKNQSWKTKVEEVNSKNKELKKVITEGRKNSKLDSLEYSLKTAIKQLSHLKKLPYLSKNVLHEENLRNDLRIPDCSSPESKQVFVIREGKTTTISVQDNETVYDLKMKIEIKNNIPICRQRLMYAGKKLEDEAKLSFYNIQKESNLQLFIRNLVSSDSL